MKIKFENIGRSKYCDTLELKNLLEAFEIVRSKLISDDIEMSSTEENPSIFNVYAGVHNVGKVIVLD